MTKLFGCVKTKFEQNTFYSSTSHAFGGAFTINFPLGCDQKFVVKHNKNMKNDFQ